jgi:hypothetical protein
VSTDQCRTVNCKTNADCVDGPGGQCVVYHEKCSYRNPSPFDTKACRYTTDPCRTDEDCDAMSYYFCLPGSKTAGFDCRMAECPGK